MTNSQQYLICELNDQRFGHLPTINDYNTYHIRRAARGILRYQNKIALLHVSKRGYYKFPGGGFETNETAADAFKREALEEAGCHSEVIDEAGITLEYRDQLQLLQISYVLMAKVIGEPGPQHLEEGELEDGHDLVWLTVEEAEKTMSESNPTDYEHMFINRRDQEILKFYKEKILSLPSTN